jgi:hypothetical protein
MSESATQLRHAVVEGSVRGPGHARVAERQAAFDNVETPASCRALLDKVARHAYKVTAEDVAGAKVAGASEDQIFELVVCAALGQATRQLDAAFAALEAATEDRTQKSTKESA